MAPPNTAVSTQKHRILVGIGVVLISGFLFFLWKGLEKAGTPIPGAQTGLMAKQFKVKWVQGQEHLKGETGEYFTLDDFKGRPIILNYWASWCVSCRQEARDLELTWQALKKDDVVVVGIAIQDTVEAAKAFALQYGKTYILGLDEGGRASIDYGITGVPETFFINREGHIVHKEATPLTVESLTKFSQMIR